MKASISSTLALSACVERLTLNSSAYRPSIIPKAISALSKAPATPSSFLTSSTTRRAFSNLARDDLVFDGGSSRGTTVVWGDYGLRMCDHHRRVSALQLKNGEEAIKVRLRGMRYRLFKRVCASIGVYASGNEVRMGKGKGSFDHWASRIAVSKVIFELKGDIHEQVARDAFRLAGNKMPGMYEFVKKGDPAVVGVTKLDGVTMEELKRPRRAVPLPMPSPVSAAEAVPEVPKPTSSAA
ncbi:hypothetical protein VE04_01529 [Pseudogymnoascus sp. 24MN13]|nr:hypothetical protein VE04_01529 [Pseudogymnoascus sp. 24MN13]